MTDPLTRALDQTQASQASITFVLVVAMVLYGLFCLLHPQVAWKLFLRRLWLQEEEPSPRALTTARIAGVICILLAGLLLISG